MNASDLAEYERWLTDHGVSAHTRRAYAGVVRRWAESGEDLQAWARERLLGAPSGTAGQLRAALRHWRASRGEPEIAFARGARGRRVAREPLTERDLASFYRKVTHTPGLLPGVRVVLLLLPRTGLRVSEACALRGQHLRRVAGGWTVRVVGKGGHERTIPLTSEAERLLVTYAETYRGVAGGAFARDAWLFEGGSAGAPLPADTVRWQLRGIRGRQPWSPHVLRHTFATRYHHANNDLMALSQILGHRSIETTRIYVQASATHKRAGMERAELAPPKRAARRRRRR